MYYVNKLHVYSEPTVKSHTLEQFQRIYNLKQIAASGVEIRTTKCGVTIFLGSLFWSSERYSIYEDVQALRLCSEALIFELGPFGSFPCFRVLAVSLSSRRLWFDPKPVR